MPCIMDYEHVNGRLAKRLCGCLQSRLERFDSVIDLQNETNMNINTILMKNFVQHAVRIKANCKECLYMQMNGDGGHCYMFEHSPGMYCGVFKQGRIAGEAQVVER